MDVAIFLCPGRPCVVYSLAQNLKLIIKNHRKKQKHFSPFSIFFCHFIFSKPSWLVEAAWMKGAPKKPSEKAPTGAKVSSIYRPFLSCTPTAADDSIASDSSSAVRTRMPKETFPPLSSSSSVSLGWNVVLVSAGGRSKTYLYSVNFHRGAQLGMVVPPIHRTDRTEAQQRRPQMCTTNHRVQARPTPYTSGSRSFCFFRPP